MILGLIDEAVGAGARLAPACKIIGLSVKTIQRWRKQGGGCDRRHGPHSEPGNKLSAAERQEVLEIATSSKYCDLSPHQIVPRLADEGSYVASEATMYRILRAEALLSHREPSRPAVSRRPEGRVAPGPNQVAAGDITYLCSPVRGSFYYLYVILDVWSRKIMGAEVYKEESMELASELFEQTCGRHELDPDGLVLHSDNGSPMKGATMLATLKRLGVAASFSRPRVSDDNPFSEALFRTVKMRPEYPSGPFASLENARLWVAGFVRWYNTEHLHSSIRFVTPEDRHTGREEGLLQQRQRVYERARRRNPRRWSGATRNWQPIQTVYLNPEKKSSEDLRTAA